MSKKSFLSLIIVPVSLVFLTGLTIIGCAAVGLVSLVGKTIAVVLNIVIEQAVYDANLQIFLTKKKRKQELVKDFVRKILSKDDALLKNDLKQINYDGVALEKFDINGLALAAQYYSSCKKQLKDALLLEKKARNKIAEAETKERLKHVKKRLADIEELALLQIQRDPDDLKHKHHEESIDQYVENNGRYLGFGVALFWIIFIATFFLVCASSCYVWPAVPLLGAANPVFLNVLSILSGIGGAMLASSRVYSALKNNVIDKLFCLKNSDTSTIEKKEERSIGWWVLAVLMVGLGGVGGLATVSAIYAVIPAASVLVTGCSMIAGVGMTCLGMENGWQSAAFLGKISFGFPDFLTSEWRKFRWDEGDLFDTVLGLEWLVDPVLLLLHCVCMGAPSDRLGSIPPKIVWGFSSGAEFSGDLGCVLNSHDHDGDEEEEGHSHDGWLKRIFIKWPLDFATWFLRTPVKLILLCCSSSYGKNNPECYHPIKWCPLIVKDIGYSLVTIASAISGFFCSSPKHIHLDDLTTKKIQLKCEIEAKKYKGAKKDAWEYFSNNPREVLDENNNQRQTLAGHRKFSFWPNCLRCNTRSTDVLNELAALGDPVDDGHGHSHGSCSHAH